jgi:hypothetical protein
MVRRRLRARDARSMSTAVSDADTAAYIEARRLLDTKIRALARHRPNPGTSLVYDMPAWLPGVPNFDVKNVCVLMYAGLRRDGYDVGWSQENPMQLHVDWLKHPR